MKFERNRNRLGTTWAFSEFKDHHTEVNNIYWAFVPTWSFTYYLARHAVGVSPVSLFKVSGPDAHRVEGVMPVFIRHQSQLSNWVRLSVLLSMLSYLELYVRKAVTLALWSDPAIRFGKPGAIDGVTWLKSGLKDDLEPFVVAVTKGDWRSRILSYEKLFGPAPPDLAKAASDLDRMRVLRNRVGHAYGRDLKLNFGQGAAGGMAKLDEADLKQFMQVTFNVAAAIDEHLYKGHVGSFEELLYFHEWRPALKGTSRLDEGKSFRKPLNQLGYGRSASTEYGVGLAEHYRRC